MVEQTGFTPSALWGMGRALRQSLVFQEPQLLAGRKKQMEKNKIEKK